MAIGAMDFGQCTTIIIMAVALGLDALSLGVGIGLKGIRWYDMIKMSVAIGLFHIIMPFLGMFAGRHVGEWLGHVTVYVGGSVLIVIGTQMILHAVRASDLRPNRIEYRSSSSMMLLSFSVSMDSFSVGVSLGMLQSYWLFTIATFGFFGGAMFLLGLFLGRRVSYNLGCYGEAIGGAILLAFGLIIIF